MITATRDADHLAAATRLAVRGRGGAEPNPLVGCVIVSTGDDVVGWGYHRRCGGPHAEIEALRRAGACAAGSTAYVTLEPCNHTGRTGPCTEALIEAGIARVVFARRDPGVPAGGGAERLRTAGIEVQLCDSYPAAAAVSDPYVRRVSTGLPWVIAKWAQTVDGRIATRSGESRWISGTASRSLVHRKRGQVDAILTGIGTVLADNPLLTARDVTRRRTARRVVIDPDLQTPPACHLVTTTDQAPTTIVCDTRALDEQPSSADVLRRAGVEILDVPGTGVELDPVEVLRALVARHEITNLLVEAGPGVLSRLFRARLVNEAWVFVAPLLLGDDRALPCVRGLDPQTLTDGCSLELWNIRRRDDDVVLRYGVPTTVCP